MAETGSGGDTEVLLRPPQGFIGAAGDPVQVGADGIARVPREVAAELLRRNEGWRVVRMPIPAGELARLRERLTFLEERAHDLGEALLAAGEEEGVALVDLESLRADLIEGHADADRVVRMTETVERVRLRRREIGAAIDALKKEHEQASLRLAAEERLRRTLDDRG